MPAGRCGRLRALLPRALLVPGPEDLRLLGHMLVCRSRPSTPKFLGALTGSFFWLHVLVSMQDLFVSARGILFRDPTGTSTWGAWSLSHYTTREVVV